MFKIAILGPRCVGKKTIKNILARTDGLLIEIETIKSIAGKKYDVYIVVFDDTADDILIDGINTHIDNTKRGFIRVIFNKSDIISREQQTFSALIIDTMQRVMNNEEVNDSNLNRLIVNELGRNALKTLETTQDKLDLIKTQIDSSEVFDDAGYTSLIAFITEQMTNLSIDFIIKRVWAKATANYLFSDFMAAQRELDLHTENCDVDEYADTVSACNFLVVKWKYNYSNIFDYIALIRDIERFSVEQHKLPLYVMKDTIDRTLENLRKEINTITITITDENIEQLLNLQNPIVTERVVEYISNNVNSLKVPNFHYILFKLVSSAVNRLETCAKIIKLYVGSNMWMNNFIITTPIKSNEIRYILLNSLTPVVEFSDFSDFTKKYEIFTNIMNVINTIDFTTPEYIKNESAVFAPSATGKKFVPIDQSTIVFISQKQLPQRRKTFYDDL